MSLQPVATEPNPNPMKELPIYHVLFILKNAIKPQVRSFKGIIPGEAFWKCKKKFPDCQLLEGWREEKLPGGGDFRISYAPPSTIRIIAEPEPKAEQTHFGFFEQISFDREEQHHEATTSMPLTNSSHIAAETAEEKAMLQRCARRRHAITGTLPPLSTAAST
jgi:hypothetical protein